MIKIGNTEIALDRPPYYIADIAANHNGDLGRAYRLIELAKESGAHVAKFQNFKVSKIVSKWGFNREIGQLSHQAMWTKSVVDTYSEASLPDAWSPLLKAHCNKVGIEYMTSPYDFDSVDLADKYADAFKVGSGDITWTDILRHIASKGKPVLLATGASSMEDVKRAVSMFDKSALVLMQCNTNYTADRENLRYVNLNVLKTYAVEFPGVILGLSDHTHGCATAAGAISLGARVIEKHFTDDNNQEGPDHHFAMNPETFREMVRVCDDIYCALGDGAKCIEKNEQETAVIQRRGLYYTGALSAGNILKVSDFEVLRPALSDGFAPYEVEGLIGKTLARDVEAGAPVKKADIT